MPVGCEGVPGAGGARDKWTSRVSRPRLPAGEETPLRVPLARLSPFASIHLAFVSLVLVVSSFTYPPRRKREGGWKGELHVGGSKSIFALYAASNADKFLPRGEKERKPRSPFVSSSHEIARGSRGASTLDLFPLKFGSLKGVEKESALAREASRALSRGSGSGFHGINDFQGGVSVEIKL